MPPSEIAGIGCIVSVIGLTTDWSSIGIVSPDGIPPMTGASEARRG